MHPVPAPPSAEDIARLVKVALGQAPADLVIRGARLVNVFSESVEPPGALAVAAGRVASLGPELAGWVGPDTVVHDGAGRFLIPGLIDAHTHLDSIFQLGPYSDLALARGNTTAVSETGMIAGAWGARGVRAFLAETEAAPMRVFFVTPALVPPFPALETSAGMSADEIVALLDHPACLGVGETYWPAVTDLDPRPLAAFAAALAMGKRVGGHAAGARQDKLMAYAAAGVSDCHESTTAEEAYARIRLGLMVQVREGIVRREMEAVVPALKDLADTRLVSLVSDLCPLDELVSQGVMNLLAKKAVALGVAPARAVAWCSLNPARYYRLPGLGAAAPGYVADLVLVDDLKDFNASAVFLGGRLVARDGAMLAPTPPLAWPAEARASLRCPAVTVEMLKAPARGERARVRVARAVNGTITRAEEGLAPVRGGSACADPAADLYKMAHVNRHQAGLEMAVGFCSGWGLRSGALATTLIWDTCNLFGIGASDAELAFALNRVRELGGGMAVVTGGEVLAELPLPIAGVTSPEPVAAIQARVEQCEAALRRLGCGLERPFLAAQTFCFTGLPFLRLTNKGLVDIRRRQFVEVVL
ncbi:MAG: adenine deaminase C-terminal domain-containing protein [Thermodesulfobacteriota bacterium]